MDAGRARVRRAAGQHERALVELRRAQATLASCGAVPYRDEAGAHIRRLSARGGMGLTARELQIAALVARGDTNQQIAAELFISEETAEATLSRVFRKVGVRSRAALATAMAHIPDR